MSYGHVLGREQHHEPSRRLHGHVQPFVKWVGGKRAILDSLARCVPTRFASYWEPFLGGGALYYLLHDRLRRRHLSDANQSLIHTYQVIRDHPEPLLKRLAEHAALHSPEYYYHLRGVQPQSELEIAARFIYLNKTCFNGLYRVNRAGRFNVPIGRYDHPNIVQEENLRACSKALRKANLVCRDFESIRPRKGDFVYFDPPYYAEKRANFTQYTGSDFSEHDHIRLKEFIDSLTRRKVYVLLSNSATPFIREMYHNAGYHAEIVLAPRAVNSKGDGRGLTEELLIANFRAGGEFVR